MSKKRKSITPGIDKSELDKQEKLIEKITEGDSEKMTVRVTLDIPKPFHKHLKNHTKKMGQTIKGYLLWLASEDLEKREKD